MAARPRRGTKGASADKNALHPRNPHRGRYDFRQLIACTPELAAFVATNEHGIETIDFADPLAVKALNRALLQQQYGIGGWDIPAQYLCPPIPGRADYLHYLADLLAEGGVIPQGPSVRVLDIGVGANCVYPLIGHRSYGWQFVGTDIDPVALANAQRILDANGLSEVIGLRLQRSRSSVFAGVVESTERFDLAMCNPPFHASLEEACAGTQRKWRNLGKPPAKNSAGLLNFGGQGAELCCEGGEEAFVSRMVDESASYAGNCLWFTTLISKSASLPGVYRALKKTGVRESRTIDMAQGQKKSRIVAWTFLDESQQRAWRAARRK
ncbi:MAG TPA: 23S rRNA (adenine(1618)-N(6))-methyltransferase RlmF [Gallionella sp.]|nr:23S rRNA (adenine(1618)-N(6))-methyltransferase RlmF [Gallionella sp.]